MLYYFNENIVNTEAPAIIHGCNLQAKMNSGVAKAIREHFPEAYTEYMDKIYTYNLGQIIVADSKGKLIGNLLTQDNYGYDGKKYANKTAIKIAVDTFCFYYRSRYVSMGIDGYRPIATPKIGCGRGGLSWEGDRIRDIFEEISNYHKIDFYVYDQSDQYSETNK